MGETIDIREYLDLIKKRKKIIIVIVLVFMIGGGVLQYLHNRSYVPTYTSTVSVRININKNTKKNSDKKDKDDESTDYQTTDLYSASLQSSTLNQNIGSQYSSLATSKSAILALKDKLDLQGTPESIASSITVKPEEKLTEFIDISVTNYDSKLAQKIAAEMPKIFNDELKRVIGLDCVQQLYDASEAKENAKPVDNTFRNFTLVGIALAIFVVLLLECLDNKIVTPDDAEKYWGLPVIGVVPFEKENTKGKVIKSKA